MSTISQIIYCVIAFCGGNDNDCNELLIVINKHLCIIWPKLQLNLEITHNKNIQLISDIYLSFSITLHNLYQAYTNTPLLKSMQTNHFLNQLKRTFSNNK